MTRYTEYEVLYQKQLDTPNTTHKVTKELLRVEDEYFVLVFDEPPFDTPTEKIILRTKDPVEATQKYRSIN